MKIALYIDDRLEQIVLTPQTDAEKNILARLSEEGRDLTISRGEFYANQAGYVRHQAPTVYSMGRTTGGDLSTILVLRPKAPTPPEFVPGFEEHTDGPFPGVPA